MSSYWPIQPDQPELRETPPKPESAVNYPIYFAMFDYSKRVPEDLSFKKGDLMFIINTGDGDWWKARLKDSGREGYIPSNYVVKYTGVEKEE